MFSFSVYTHSPSAVCQQLALVFAKYIHFQTTTIPNLYPMERVNRLGGEQGGEGGGWVSEWVGRREGQK